MPSDTSWREATITLSFAPGKTRNATNNTYSICKLVDGYFSKHRIREHKDSYGFSCELVNDAPAELGKNLKNANAKAWPLLAFDFDDGEPSYEDEKHHGFALSSDASGVGERGGRAVWQ